MKSMQRRGVLKAGVVALGIGIGIGSTAGAWAQETETPTTKCNVNVDTDSGKGGMQTKICNDNTATVGVSGPIKDVDRDHPLGKGKAAIPQAGRDAQSVVSHGGHTIEDGAHYIGDRTGIHIHW